MGCTLNGEPSWLSVFSPRIASIATRALNFGLYCFLVVVIDLSFVNDSAENLSLLPGLKSGDHYTLHFICQVVEHVQIGKHDEFVTNFLGHARRITLRQDHSDRKYGEYTNTLDHFHCLFPL